MITFISVFYDNPKGAQEATFRVPCWATCTKKDIEDFLKELKNHLAFQSH